MEAFLTGLLSLCAPTYPESTIPCSFGQTTYYQRRWPATALPLLGAVRVNQPITCALPVTAAPFRWIRNWGSVREVSVLAWPTPWRVFNFPLKRRPIWYLGLPQHRSESHLGPGSGGRGGRASRRRGCLGPGRSSTATNAYTGPRSAVRFHRGDNRADLGRGLEGDENRRSLHHGLSDPFPTDGFLGGAGSGNEFLY